METINHEYYVSLEVAKLLKEAGFDWDTLTYYPIDDEVLNERALVGSNVAINHNRDDSAYSASTLSVAQRWLREVKGFMVETIFITDEYGVIYQANLYEVISENSAGRVGELISVVKGQSELKRTYEEAQESGIKKALELILEKGNENNNNKL